MRLFQSLIAAAIAVYCVNGQVVTITTTIGVSGSTTQTSGSTSNPFTIQTDTVVRPTTASGNITVTVTTVANSTELTSEPITITSTDSGINTVTTTTGINSTSETSVSPPPGTTSSETSTSAQGSNTQTAGSIRTISNDRVMFGSACAAGLSIVAGVFML